MTILPEYFTILTDEAPRYKVTARKGFNLVNHLIDKGLQVSQVQGVFGGIAETSYLVALTGNPRTIQRKQKQLEHIANALGQAAVFHWEAGKRGVLVHTNGVDRHKWEISKQHRVSDAKPLGDYTRINGLYSQVAF